MVSELRVALTVADYEEAVRFYRDALGLPVVETFDGGVVLAAGQATLELLSTEHAEQLDRIEVGERSAGPVRLALEVDDSETTARKLTAAGAKLLGGPVVTPWSHRNVRLRAPDGMQLTLFTILDDAES
jgi:lactoylglutathione lyase